MRVIRVACRNFGWFGGAMTRKRTSCGTHGGVWRDDGRGGAAVGPAGRQSRRVVGSAGQPAAPPAARRPVGAGAGPANPYGVGGPAGPRQVQMMGGSFPRSFLIPGTDTSIRVGGEIRTQRAVLFQRRQPARHQHQRRPHRPIEHHPAGRRRQIRRARTSSSCRRSRPRSTSRRAPRPPGARRAASSSSTSRAIRRRASGCTRFPTISPCVALRLWHPGRLPGRSGQLELQRFRTPARRHSPSAAWSATPAPPA